MGEYELDNYSYEDYLDIDKTTPESERYELIFGHIYMMSGASRLHQDVVLSIALLFKTLQKERGCKTVIAPFDIKLSCDAQTNVVQPDVMLFCEEEQLPCLVVEVLSPSTAHKDKTVKKELYECARIKEYFVVETEYNVIERFVLKNDRYEYAGAYGKGDEMEIRCIGAKIEVAKIFEGIESEAE